MTPIQSWGRAKTARSEIATDLFETDDLVLAVGSRLSYGDSCLNDGGYFIETKVQDCLLSFDPDSRLVRAQAGVTFEHLLKFLVPRGFFVPVTPGTKFITLGGAIANDVHGKNHHGDGTFGNWLKTFKLRRSDGDFICSPSENPELFAATIGGLGLTGLIEWAQFEVIPIKSAYIDVTTIKFESLEEFMCINEDSLEDKYTVAWVDCLNKRKVRGLYMRGDHSEKGGLEVHRDLGTKAVPIDFPGFVLNKYSVKAFNFAYFNKQQSKEIHSVQHYDPFFYPLDSVKNWNRIYGKSGLFQFQCVLPMDRAMEGIGRVLSEIRLAGEGSFLSVLKTFGASSSPGMLSFPKEGVTLALDFSNRGKKTLELLDRLYSITAQYEGRIYPAKDQVLSRQLFERFYPNFKEFEPYVDAKFSSDWWRRVRRIE